MRSRHFTPEIARAALQADSGNLRSLIILHDVLTEASDADEARSTNVRDDRREATILLEGLILGRIEDAQASLERVERLIRRSCDEDPGRSIDAPPET